MEKNTHQQANEPYSQLTPSLEERFRSMKNFNFFDKNQFENLLPKEKWSISFLNQDNANSSSKKFDYNELQEGLEGIFSDFVTKIRTIVTPLNDDTNFSFEKKNALSKSQTSKTSLDRLSQDSQKDEEYHENGKDNREWEVENTCPVCFENFDNFALHVIVNHSQSSCDDQQSTNDHSTSDANERSKKLLAPRELLCGHIVCTGCIQDLLSPPGLACPVCFTWQDCESALHLNVKNFNKIEPQPQIDVPNKLSQKNYSSQYNSKPNLFSDTDILSALSMSVL